MRLEQSPATVICTVLFVLFISLLSRKKYSFQDLVEVGTGFRCEYLSTELNPFPYKI